MSSCWRAGALLLVVAAWGVACTGASPAFDSGGSESQPISHGEDDVGHRAVAPLYAGHLLVCSGVLIAPRVLLTAAHCFIGPTPPTSVRFEGVDGERAIVHRRVAETFQRSTLVGDVALALLDRDAPVTPLAIARGLPPSIVGATARVIGFGRDPHADGGTGVRRSGTAIVKEVLPTQLVIRPADALPCSGDSGGPALVDVEGQEQIVGVATSADEQCAQIGVLTRVDPFARTLVDSYLEFVGQTWLPIGAPCATDSSCASRSCVPVVGAPTIRYCSRLCDTDAECGEGMMCAIENAQTFACRPRVRRDGAPGTPCHADGECGSLACLRRSSTPEGTCVATCRFGDYCGPGARCEATDAPELPFACVAHLDAGPPPFVADRVSSCSLVAGSTSANGAPGTWTGLALGALTLVRRRRRSGACALRAPRRCGRRPWRRRSMWRARVP